MKTKGYVDFDTQGTLDDFLDEDSKTTVEFDEDIMTIRIWGKNDGFLKIRVKLGYLKGTEMLSEYLDSMKWLLETKKDV